jgi:two-component system, OmpR family, response regulator
MMRVLVVEDEAPIAADMRRGLEANGYTVEHAADGETAWFQGGTADFAAVVLDLGLPRLDGLTVLKRWRSEGVKTPVLVLTARGAWTERVEGIDAGADDYLPKPFQFDELLARLRAIIRRSVGEASSLLTSGKLTLDTRTMRASVEGRPLTLTPLEYRLLALLMHRVGKMVPQTEITEQLYAQDFERDSNSIEVLVGRLRRKLGPGVIETRKGFGYTISGV